jgi:hypothetical protein
MKQFHQLVMNAAYATDIFDVNRKCLRSSRWEKELNKTTSSGSCLIDINEMQSQDQINGLDDNHH